MEVNQKGAYDGFVSTIDLNVRELLEKIKIFNLWVVVTRFKSTTLRWMNLTQRK